MPDARGIRFRGWGGGEGGAYFILITLGGGGGVVTREGRLLGTAYLVLTLAHKCV